MNSGHRNFLFFKSEPHNLTLKSNRLINQLIENIISAHMYANV